MGKDTKQITHQKEKFLEQEIKKDKMDEEFKNKFFCKECQNEFEVSCPECNSKKVVLLKQDLVFLCPWQNSKSFGEVDLQHINNQILKNKRGRTELFEDAQKFLVSNREIDVPQFISARNVGKDTEGYPHRKILNILVCQGKAQKEFMGKGNRHKYISINREKCPYLKIENNGKVQCMFNWLKNAKRKSRKDFDFKHE